MCCTSTPGIPAFGVMATRKAVTHEGPAAALPEFRQAGPQRWASIKPSTRAQASRHARSCAANLRSKNECGALS